MKQIRFLTFASCVLAGFLAGSARAAAPVAVEQNMNISVTESYVATTTNALNTITNQTIKTATITTANVVKAIATDLAMPSLINGQLIHKIKLADGSETMFIRKGLVETNVSAFFGTLAPNFNMTATTNDYVKTNFNEAIVSGVTTNFGRTNITDSLNSLSLTTSNLAFILTNGYGTAFYFNRMIPGTNYTWANISCGGGVTVLTNNIGVWTNALKFTNAVGPAQGSFSTTSGTVK